MTFFTDHLSQIVTLILAFSGIVATWTRLKFLVDETRTQVLENRSHMDKEFEKLENLIHNDIASCHTQRSALAALLADHQKASEMHTTAEERQLHGEWRATVLSKLDRLERLILRINGDEK